MASEGNPTADLGSQPPYPPVQKLISQLKSSFFSTEFENLAKTLMEREEHLNQKVSEFEREVNEAKDMLFSDNRKLISALEKNQMELDALRAENLELKTQIELLNSEKCRVSEHLGLEDELKKKQREIDATRQVNEKMDRKIRVYKNRCLDFDVRVSSLEKLAKEFMGAGSSSIDLENKKQKNCSSERSKPPVFSKRKDSNNKTEPKSKVVIQIDDDDDDVDDDQGIISKLKGKQVSTELKRKYLSVDDDDDKMVFSTVIKQQGSKEIKRDNNGAHELHNHRITSPLLSTSQSAKSIPVLEKTEVKNFTSSLDTDSSSGSDNEKINEVYISTIARLKKEKEKKLEKGPFFPPRSSEKKDRGLEIRP